MHCTAEGWKTIALTLNKSIGCNTAESISQHVSGAGAVEISAHASFCNPRSPLCFHSTVFFHVPLIQFSDPLRSAESKSVFLYNTVLVLVFDYSPGP